MKAPVLAIEDLLGEIPKQLYVMRILSHELRRPGVMEFMCVIQLPPGHELENEEMDPFEMWMTTDEDTGILTIAVMTDTLLAPEQLEKGLRVLNENRMLNLQSISRFALYADKDEPIRLHTSWATLCVFQDVDEASLNVFRNMVFAHMWKVFTESAQASLWLSAAFAQERAQN